MAHFMEITSELLAGFLDEAPEYLDLLDAGLMALETQAGADGNLALDREEDQEQMNEMFRAAHSLKGLAAAFGFQKIKNLTHLMETLFDQVRMKQRSLNVSSFEALFRVFDRLKELVQELTQDQQNVPIDDMLTVLNNILDGNGGHTTKAAVAAPVAVSSQPALAPSTDSQCAAQQATNAPVTADREQVTPSSQLLADPSMATMFVDTTSEAMEELSQQLLQLEETPDDRELLNGVFRAAHNIKGASGAVGLTRLNRMTHEMESVLDDLRHGRQALCEAMVSVLLAGTDAIRDLVSQMKNGVFDDLAEATLHEITKRLHEANGGQPPAKNEPTGETTPMPQATITHDASDSVCAGQLDITISFADNDDESLIQSFLVKNRLEDMGTLVSCTPDLDHIAGSGNVTRVQFVLATDRPIAEVERIVRSYRTKEAIVTGGSASDICVASDAVAAPTCTAQQPSIPTAEPASFVEQATDSISETVAATSQAVVSESTPLAAEGAAANTSPASSTNTQAPRKAGGGTAKKEAPPAKMSETLRVDQERLDELMNLGGELVINRARFAQIHGEFKSVFDGRNYSYLLEDISDRLQRLSSTDVEVGGRGADVPLRREVTHLQQSFDVIRGLVERVHEARSAMYHFDEALHGLNRVSDGIQRGVMSTRMVPIGPLFQRFRRVVRDICKANGKQVELELIGEATELDKRMIDELGDPLTHMVRNSVDHGMEMPEARQALGKNPVGTVTLEACHRGNNICIEVRDDGAGVNVEKVRRKIVEKQLATESQVEQMSDKEIVQYIFMPGFSTAAQVTDISGRGMGMDIVRSKIENLSGTLEVDSVPGQGTRVVIKLPLTLAIIRSLVTRIGEYVYALPLESVAEIITVRKQDLQYIQRQRVVRVRERIIPVLFFEDVFGATMPELQTRSRENDDMTVVVLATDNTRISLVVDDLIGQEDVVIKSLAENYRNIRGLAGASIRGDGNVSLILDIGTMVEMASKGANRLANGAVSTPTEVLV